MGIAPHTTTLTNHSMEKPSYQSVGRLVLLTLCPTLNTSYCRFTAPGWGAFDAVRCAEDFLDHAKDENQSEALLADNRILYTLWRENVVASFASAIEDAPLLGSRNEVQCGERSFAF